MPRPRRYRYVGSQPVFDYFKPRGISLIDLEEVVLKVEEFESIRLKDYMNMDQTKAASEMGISQPTFYRILSDARKKIAGALVEGKAIKIYGGDYELVRVLKCYDCLNEWEDRGGRMNNCPQCGSINIYQKMGRYGHGGKRL